MDINEINVDDYKSFCPYCGKIFLNDIYLKHIEDCNKMLVSIVCEICFVDIDNDSNNEKYISHLLSAHTMEEIESKVTNNSILSTLGIEPKYKENNLLENFSNKSISSLSKNIGKNQTKLSNPFEIKSKIFFSNKDKIGNVSNVIKCKLCSNLVNDNKDDKSQHLINFHQAFDFIPEMLNSLYENSSEIDLSSIIKNFYICKKCKVIMENEENVKKFHQFNCPAISYAKDSKIYKNLYCNLCKSDSKTFGKNHHHFSYLNINNNSSQLVKNNKYSPIKLPVSYNNIKNNLWGAYENSFDYDSEIHDFSFLSGDSNNDDIVFDEKKIINTDVDKVIKLWENFTSISRKIDERLEAEFNKIFSGRVFDYVEILKLADHYYSKEKKASSANLLKRLNNEFNKFKDNLPCNFSSSYFIRADVNYPQFIKVLIAGSRGTPYEHGLYEFDVYLPPDYPNGVPKCTLRTTGKKNIRFNPNLYVDGKVCLSLLGTWSGSSVEKWDPKVSNLTQLFLSLSSLVMNDRIIENEPGYENSLNSMRGLTENEGYSNIVRMGNISYAIIDMYKNPSPAFDTLITDYFNFKSTELIHDIHTWIERIPKTECNYDGLTKSHNPSWCNSIKGNNYEVSLKKKIEELKTLLNLNI